MGWVEKKARELVLAVDGPMLTSVHFRSIVERAIRETIEACARAVEDAGGDNEEYHAEAIRKLGEP